MEDNNQTTNNAEDLEQLAMALCRHYGVQSPEQLGQHPEFQRHLADTMDPGMALQRMNRHVEDGVAVAGFFVGNRVFTKKMDDGSYKQTGEGPSILIAETGIIQSFNTGKQLSLSKMSRVMVGPVKRTTVIDSGVITVKATRETDVQVKDHGIAIPSLGLDTLLEVARAPNKARGVINGDTGNYPRFATLTVGSDQMDISYFPSGQFGPESLKLVCYDEKDQAVSINVRCIPEIRETFGIDAGAEREDYQAALAGEPIAVNGKMGLLIPAQNKLFSESGEDEEEGYTQLTDAIEQLDAMGAIKPLGKKPDSPKGLYLKDLGKQTIKVNGVTVWDIQQQKNKKTGELEWVASINQEERGANPWMACHESAWKNANGEGVWNEGGFLIFTNHLGGKATLPKDNKFAKMAAQFGLASFDTPNTGVPTEAKASTGLDI